MEGQFQVLASLPTATQRLYNTFEPDLSQLGPQQHATRWQLQLKEHWSTDCLSQGTKLFWASTVGAKQSVNLNAARIGKVTLRRRRARALSFLK